MGGLEVILRGFGLYCCDDGKRGDSSKRKWDTGGSALVIVE